MSNSSLLLKVEDLRTHFFTEDGTVKAVDGVSFCISEGETVALVGESGCGKSVTALSILGLVTPAGKIVSGQIHFRGEEIGSLSKRELCRLRGARISIIFQEPMTSLNPVKTCGKQIVESILTHSSLSRGEAKKETLDLLNKVRIPDPARRFRSYPHELSGGMRQRVMIAMALATRSELLIADEPTTALDVSVQAEIIDLLMELQSTMGLAILFITHDLGLVKQIAARILVMYAGQIVEEGKTGELVTSPLHPYTKALLECLPSIESTSQQLSSIPGNVPVAGRYPSGCRFHPRCAIAREECSATEPKLVLGPDRRKVRCPYAV